MNKFSELVSESLSFEELEDHVLVISRLLGKHKSTTLKYGDGEAYIFYWDLDLDLGGYNGSENIEKVKNLFNIIDEISVAMKRVQDYDIEFKIQEKLYIRFIPHTEKQTEYKFIVGQKWRQVDLDYSQIVKFFKDRDFTLKNAVVLDAYDDDSTSVKITTNADDICQDEFMSMFNEEADKKFEEGEINREIECIPTFEVGTLVIRCPYGKTFVTIEGA